MPGSPTSDVQQAPGAVDDVAPEEVVEALSAILDSETFGASPRSRDFLAYIVSEHLAGRQDRLVEHAVARHALGRAEYDARLNSSVRVQASRLRTALERYHDSEGARATVRISLPPGTYAPRIARQDPGRRLATAHDQVSVVVLRFGSTGPAADLISATLCDVIAHRLADFPGLTVIGPSVVATEAEAAARLLGARFALHGSVTATEDAVGLVAALTDASSGEIVWRIAECVAATGLGGTGLEDRWAAAVAAQVGDSTGVIFRRALARDEHSGSVLYAARLAYTDYLMKGTSESIVAAAAALDQALASGRSAEVLAMRGAIHNAEVSQGSTPTEREHELRCAEQLAREALALSPASASAYLVLVVILLSSSGVRLPASCSGL